MQAEYISRRWDMQETPYVKVGASLRDRIKELNDTELRVLLALGLRIDEERKCWPALHMLAQECTRTERMVQYALNKLINKGFINIGRRVGGRGKTNVYTLNGYFAYGSQRVQLIAPFAVEEKGEAGKTAQPEPQIQQKGEISPEKGEINQAAQPGDAVTQKGETIKKGEISQQKGEISVQKRVKSAEADQIRKKNHISRTNIRRTNKGATHKSLKIDPHHEYVKKVFEGLKERRGYDSPRPAAEAKDIRWMLQHGYAVEQILRCYDCMKQDEFWQGIALFAMSVKSQIGEWKKHGERSRAGGRHLERGGIPDIPSAAELAADWGAETDEDSGVPDLQGGGVPKEKPGPGPP